MNPEQLEKVKEFIFGLADLRTYSEAQDAKQARDMAEYACYDLQDIITTARALVEDMEDES